MLLLFCEKCIEKSFTSLGPLDYLKINFLSKNVSVQMYLSLICTKDLIFLKTKQIDKKPISINNCKQIIKIQKNKNDKK